MRLDRWVLPVAVAAAVLMSGCSSDTPTASPPPAAESVMATPPPAEPPVTPSPRPTQGSRLAITPKQFGIHSYSTEPQVDSGAMRLSVDWDTLEPAEGRFDWAPLDALVTQAESWGYRDILFYIFATPPWAQTPVRGKDLSVAGAGTAQPPKNMASYENFVSALARRYRGRITSYEPWNEPSSPQFFTGTPQQAARMTEVARRAVKAVDPDAMVLSASLQTHNPDYYRDFSVPYLESLADINWPVDAIAAHFYPSDDGEGSPNSRVQQIQQVKDDLVRLGAPRKLELWDTEVNYAVGLPGGSPNGRITGDRAAAWTARTFIDSWRLEVPRTYWYMWNRDYYDFPGIQMRPGTPATGALSTLADWVIGTTFTGCVTVGNAVECGFESGDGKFSIAWAERGKARIELPRTRQVCVLTGGCRNESTAVSLGQVPVRISRPAGR